MESEHVDPAILDLKRRYEADAKAASESVGQAERMVFLARQRLGRERDALRAANERLGGLLVYLNDTHGLVGDRILADGTIERAEARRGGEWYTPERRAVIAGRLAALDRVDDGA